MIKLSKPLVCAAALLLLLSGLSAETVFQSPPNTEPDKNAHPPEANQALKLLKLPRGFKATLYASEPDVRNPIAMAWDWLGQMWVAENYTYAGRKKRFNLELRDRVLVFNDRDGDGKADSRTVFADDLKMLTSVEVGQGGVWLMCPPQLLFIPDKNSDLRPDGPPQVKLDGFTVSRGNYHNFANGLRWGPDGWLYGRCGHSCPGKLGKPGTPEKQRIPIKGGIWRYHPKRDVVEVLTHGTVNPWGHDWDQHGELFFINTVIGHFWHGIPGAHFKESGPGSPNPMIFERMDMHADHWHFDKKGGWSRSRGDEAGRFGGGHAHAGMMIYQANQWPAEMRQNLYTLNLHGLRANTDRIERRGSGYVARHENDLFVTRDPWFRGLDIRQGPCGSAFVLDWSDIGECHEHSGVHRTSGRIYRISHGQPEKANFESLTNPSPENVRQLIKNPNVWFERQLRKLAPEPATAHTLRALIEKEQDTVIRLRALWHLYGMGEAPDDYLRTLLDEKDEHLRVWAIRLLTDRLPMDTIMGPIVKDPPPCRDLERFVDMAGTDPSSRVRLVLASTLQRLTVAQRGRLARALIAHKNDADDHNLPLMVWFGIYPLAESQPETLLELAGQTTWPNLRRWIARAIASRNSDLKIRVNP